MKTFIKEVSVTVKFKKKQINQTKSWKQKQFGGLVEGQAQFKFRGIHPRADKKGHRAEQSVRVQQFSLGKCTKNPHTSMWANMRQVHKLIRVIRLVVSDSPWHMGRSRAGVSINEENILAHEETSLFMLQNIPFYPTKRTTHMFQNGKGLGLPFTGVEPGVFTPEL